MLVRLLISALIRPLLAGGYSGHGVAQSIRMGGAALRPHHPLTRRMTFQSAIPGPGGSPSRRAGRLCFEDRA